MPPVTKSALVPAVDESRCSVLLTVTAPLSVMLTLDRLPKTEVSLSVQVARPRAKVKELSGAPSNSSDGVSPACVPSSPITTAFVQAPSTPLPLAGTLKPISRRPARTMVVSRYDDPLPANFTVPAPSLRMREMAVEG
ncbi:MAG: hypothetical protein BWX70_03041 [Verrucomicrobia bacterium ADurb.Bin070]|nr:MAG: hypothetical protein BWX70_03041 [Verrucomicrobia bacterium ADurb.Bin070]